MDIKIGNYKIKPHNDLCWEVFEYRMTTPRGKHKDLEPEEKWISTGKYPPTLALALTEVYEMAVKTELGLYDLKDALVAAKRIELSIERAAKAALAKEGAMKEIYVVTQYDRTVIAMECEKDAAALAEKLGGKVEPVQLVECRRPQPTPRGLTADEFVGGVVR